jgi:uncharacterized protein YndB with AHSA1/START domain
MRRIARWLLGIFGVLIALLLAATLTGVFIPRKHVVSATVTLDQPPEMVWRALTDYRGQARWRNDVQSVEQLPERNNREIWREHYKNGEQLTLETTVAEPPRLMVRTIADADLPFSGHWEYVLTPDNQGTQLTITERGEVHNPLFRFVGKFVIGYETTITKFLDELKSHLRRKAEDKT